MQCTCLQHIRGELEDPGWIRPAFFIGLKIRMGRIAPDVFTHETSCFIQFIVQETPVVIPEKVCTMSPEMIQNLFLSGVQCIKSGNDDASFRQFKLSGQHPFCQFPVAHPIIAQAFCAQFLAESVVEHRKKVPQVQETLFLITLISCGESFPELTYESKLVLLQSGHGILQGF